MDLLINSRRGTDDVQPGSQHPNQLKSLLFWDVMQPKLVALCQSYRENLSAQPARVRYQNHSSALLRTFPAVRKIYSVSYQYL